MVKKTIKNTTISDVAEFLRSTGFILEMEVVEILAKKGYSTKVNQYFYDYDEKKKREIDIIAEKNIGHVKIFLIIECKQSLVDDWIFICSDKKPSRYYKYIKHWPDAGSIEKTKIFDNTHLLDFSIPLAQNYIVRDKFKKKKSDSHQIDTCIEKLPKALVNYVYLEKSESDRSIYLPVAIFSDQIFASHYNKELRIKKVDVVQYESSLESDGYKFHHNYNVYSGLSVLDEKPEKKEEKENSPVASINRELGYNYLIDFVTKKGFSKFVSKIELEISKINSDLWTIKK